MPLSGAANAACEHVIITITAGIRKANRCDTAYRGAVRRPVFPAVADEFNEYP